MYLPCQDWLAMQRSMLEQFAAARGSAEGDNYVEAIRKTEGKAGCAQNSQVPTNHNRGPITPVTPLIFLPFFIGAPLRTPFISGSAKDVPTYDV